MILGLDSNESVYLGPRPVLATVISQGRACAGEIMRGGVGREPAGGNDARDWSDQADEGLSPKACTVKYRCSFILPSVETKARTRHGMVGKASPFGRCRVWQLCVAPIATLSQRDA